MYPREKSQKKKGAKKMRVESVNCKSRATAYRRCPWASIVRQVEGGFIAYESWDDYKTAKRQR